MRLVEELRAEHVLIERVLGSLRTYVHRCTENDAGDAEGFLSFFREFAGSFHHGREEDTLFAALTEHAELAEGTGPVRSLLAQHRAMAATLDEIASLLREGKRDEARTASLRDAVSRYTVALLAHIDAENSVLLPESAERLRRVGIRELPCRAPTSAEEIARAIGERLAGRWPPTEDPAAIRGEGCAICSSFGVTCRGIEQEWWTDAEWETFGERQG